MTAKKTGGGGSNEPFGTGKRAKAFTESKLPRTLVQKIRPGLFFNEKTQ